MAGMENGEDQHRNGAQGGEVELDSKTLQIQAKRFYLDVKQNRRGRFIKIAEVGAGGRKSRLLLAMSTAAEFRNHLVDFTDHYAQLGPVDPNNIPDDGKIKSEVITKETRRYYLDLKENQRGRFLRVSQTIARGGPRSQIAIPAQGMEEFRDTLTELLEAHGTEDHEEATDLPGGQSVRSENKTFYFDVNQNARGVYMRVSEVRSPNQRRQSITIPERSWRQFYDTLGEYLRQRESSEEAPQGGAGPPPPQQE